MKETFCVILHFVEKSAIQKQTCQNGTGYILFITFGSLINYTEKLTELHCRYQDSLQQNLVSEMLSKTDLFGFLSVHPDAILRTVYCEDHDSTVFKQLIFPKVEMSFTGRWSLLFSITRHIFLGIIKYSSP